MKFTIIWGSDTYPMVSRGLTAKEAQELIDDLEARNLAYTVMESEHAHA